MASVMFSDDEDVSRHAAVLDEVHDTIINCKKWPSNSMIADDSKENQSQNAFDVCLENDPICRRILAEKRRPLGDVFILPMVKPAKDLNEYEFCSDTENQKEQIATPARQMEHTPLASTTQSVRSIKSNPMSSSNTPRLSHRKRARLRRLFEAEIDVHQSQSDDDQEFIPLLSTSEYESLLREKPTLEMSLRPRKEIWADEDELPLYDIQSIMRMDSLDNETSSKLNKRDVEKEPQKNPPTDDDCADFAFLPSSFHPTKDDRRTPKRSRNALERGVSRKNIDGMTSSARKASAKKVVQPSTCANRLPSAKRRRSGSDLDMDAPLSHFISSRSDRGRTPSHRPSKKPRLMVDRWVDDSGPISEDDLPLSDMKRRCTLRTRKRIDYSGLGWAED